MSDLTRLYSGGRVGMMVVLDHVSLSKDDPFAKYQQPAFFTIVEDLTPEERCHPLRVLLNGDYILQDQEGNRIRTVTNPEGRFGTNVASYLSEVSVWSAWMATSHAKAISTRDSQIHDLAVRVAVLKEVMQNQGVRVVTTEQAKTLGIKA